MKTSFVKITPKIAGEYLAKNFHGQRNLMKTHVDHLAQQMLAGQWKVNGDSIRFDKDGFLIDGQHRLCAVVKSGVTCEMLVIEGIGTDANPTIDDGRTRTGGNIMHMIGVRNYNSISSIVARTMNYRRALEANGGSGGSLSSAKRASKISMIEEYKKHPTEYQHAHSLGAKSKALSAPSNFGTVAAIAMIDGSQDVEVIDMFFNSLATGSNLDLESPAYKLRERLIKNKGSVAKLNPNQVTLLIAKAWNFYAMERLCKLLRLESENAFPIL